MYAFYKYQLVYGIYRKLLLVIWYLRMKKDRYHTSEVYVDYGSWCLQIFLCLFLCKCSLSSYKLWLWILDQTGYSQSCLIRIHLPLAYASDTIYEQKPDKFARILEITIYPSLSVCLYVRIHKWFSQLP